MKICVLGLGYVGLPLAVSLSRHYDVVGFDVNNRRIEELENSYDATAELDSETLKKSSLSYSHKEDALQGHEIYIVTVPTPVDEQNQPDLSLLVNVSKMIGPHLRKGAIVVFESTVYPGVTENVCGVTLEKASGMIAGKDFFLGYSPERINPGDKTHTIDKITKVVAGQNPEVSKILADMYRTVTEVFVAKDIKTAEAAKVIENTQRDINIAFMNEITTIFNRLDISIYDVLDAAQTKWNFLPFTPGLVGGHCIGVDPFYLAECARQLDIDPQVILAGRRVNDAMGHFISERIHQELVSLGYTSANILVLGLTFKENVPDLRNTKVIDVIEGLKSFGHRVTVVDSWADPDDAKKYYNIDLAENNGLSNFDCMIGAVSHSSYTAFTTKDFEQRVREGGLVADIKNMWDVAKIPSNRHFFTPIIFIRINNRVDISDFQESIICCSLSYRVYSASRTFACGGSDGFCSIFLERI